MPHIQSSNLVVARSTRAGGAFLSMSNPQADLQLIRMLSDRLERISADSVWAHRASGVRGALLRTIDQLQDGNVPDSKSFSHLVAIALNVLTHAAKRS
jgi:hypothetical protein